MGEKDHFSRYIIKLKKISQICNEENAIPNTSYGVTRNVKTRSSKSTHIHMYICIHLYNVYYIYELSARYDRVS